MKVRILLPLPTKETEMSTLKDMVAGGRMVSFRYYRQNELWYVTETGFEFPVPIADTGDGTFLATDKALLFMRYIRKHLETIEAGRQG
jgi:hypothetical protein